MPGFTDEEIAKNPEAAAFTKQQESINQLFATDPVLAAAKQAEFNAANGIREVVPEAPKLSSTDVKAVVSPSTQSALTRGAIVGGIALLTGIAAVAIVKRVSK